MFRSAAVFFNEGGPFMWPILIILAVSIAVMLDRFIYYFIYCSSNSKSLLPQLTSHISSNRSAEALNCLKKRNSPFYALLRTALSRFHEGASVNLIEEGIEETSIKELPKLSRRLSYLSLFANIATLVGLLGTIAGLQQSFGSLSSANPAEKAEMLSAGIAQAMNTTAFGLVVAVPCMLLYTLFTNKQQQILNDIDDVTVRIVNSMKKVRI